MLAAARRKLVTLAFVTLTFLAMLSPVAQPPVLAGDCPATGSSGCTG
jgi:hypothetical protein